MTSLTTARRVALAAGICSVAFGACVKKGADDSKKKPGAKAMQPAPKNAGMTTAMGADKERVKPVAPSMARPADMATGTAAKRPATPTDGTFVLKFDRPLKVGMHFKVVASGGRRIKTLVDAKADPRNTYQYSFVYQGVSTIKAVGASGQATGVEHKVIRLAVTKNGKTESLLQPGAVFEARVKGKTVSFTVGGKPASRKVTAILRDVVDLREQGSISTDAVFAPGAPKKLGDKWKPNVDKLLADLKNALPGAALWPRAGDVTGQVFLVSANPVNGTAALQIKAVVNLKNIAPNMGPMKVTGGSMQLALEGWLPRDVNAVGGGMQMRMIIRVRGRWKARGKPMLKITAVDHYKKVTRTPLSKAAATAILGTIASASPGGATGRVSCDQMCTKTFKNCIVETLVLSGKMTRKKLDDLKKIPGVMDKVKMAGFRACRRDCSKKKGFGSDAVEINACLKLASCTKYAHCIKKHIR